MDLAQCESEFKYADELIADKKFEEAKDVLFGIIQDDPSFGKAYNHIAWIYETQENNIEKAEEYYRLAMKFAPDYPAPYINYAYLLNNQKKFDTIEQHLQLCETIEGVNKSSLAGEWALYFEDTRQYDKAVEKYKEQALTSYDLQRIERIEDAIERCKRKKIIINL